MSRRHRCGLHLPELQRQPPLHIMSHVPQCLMSVCKSKHWTPHRLVLFEQGALVPPLPPPLLVLPALAPAALPPASFELAAPSAPAAPLAFPPLAFPPLDLPALPAAAPVAPPLPAVWVDTGSESALFEQLQMASAVPNTTQCSNVCSFMEIHELRRKGRARSTQCLEMGVTITLAAETHRLDPARAPFASVQRSECAWPALTALRSSRWRAAARAG